MSCGAVIPTGWCWADAGPLDGCDCSIVPVFRLVGYASFDQCQCPFVVCCTEAWGWFFDVLLPAGFRSCMGGAVRSLGGVCDSRVGDSCLFLFLLLGRQCLDDFGLFIRPGLLSRDGDEHVLRPTSSLSSPVWGSRAAACRLVCARCCRSACFCARCVPRLFLGFGFGVGVV